MERIKVAFKPKVSEGDTKAQVKALKQYFDFVPEKRAQVVLSMSPRFIATTLNSKLPKVHYCWDFYKWAWEDEYKTDGKGKIISKHYIDHKKYAQQLRQCDLVIVPSESQQKRLLELAKVHSVVVKSGATMFEMESNDKGYILDPLRYYPEENKTWAEDAAKELGIPIIHSEHRFAPYEFKQLIANCTFMTSCVREASTGALTLIEGLWHGKPSLIADSPYQGANEYVGKYATTFKYDDFNDLKVKMKEMWDKKSKVDINEARNYITENLTYDVMAKNLYESINRYLTTNRA